MVIRGLEEMPGTHLFRRHTAADPNVGVEGEGKGSPLVRASITGE